MARLPTPEMRGSGVSVSIPAPVGGLNTRESFAQLKPFEARALENWLPDLGNVKVRPGRTVYQTVTGATSIRNLMTWRGSSGSVLVANAVLGTGSKLVNVSGTPIDLATGYSVGARWSFANFNGWLFGVNGVDTPWRYDGVSVVATGFTGPTLTSLQTVAAVRNRLWFTRVNAANVWYGGIGAVTGALTEFQLSQVASGGKCVAIGSWSPQDAGDGADDFTVLVMNTGEVIVYQGDPATSFRLAGKYQAPRPAGVDAVMKIGGELVILTVSGPIPLSAIVSGSDETAAGIMAVWGRIGPSWAQDFRLFGNNAGWNGYYWDGLAYFVIPTGVNNSRVYVFNTRANAWTLYTGMPATQFSDYDGKLFFGATTGGKVFRHATGTDEGAQIVTLCRQGASYPGGSGRSKHFTAMRVNMQTDGACQGQVTLDVDFIDAPLNTSLFDITAQVSGASWGDDWGSDWSGGYRTPRFWRQVIGYGRAAAPVVRTRSTADNVRWSSTDLIWVKGGIL